MKGIRAMGCFVLAGALHGLLPRPPAAAQNWPSFRGADASGVAEGKSAPIIWDVEKSVNILWKTAIPGHALSSPIVWENRTFLTTAISSDLKIEFQTGEGGFAPAKDSSKQTWRVYCLNKRTGKILWERTAHEGVPKSKRSVKGSHATPTPVTNGKYVVAYFGSEGLYAYDFKGNLRWKQDLGVLNAGSYLDPDDEYGVGSSPIIYKDLVIVQCDIQRNSFIVAFDLKSGKQVWRTERDEIPSWGTPTVFTGKPRAELVTNAHRFVRGYEPLTGRELWKLSGNSYETASTPIVAHDLIFVASGFPPVQPIYAIRPGAAGDISLPEGQYTNLSVAWSKRRGGPAITTPLVYGEFLYTCSNNGILTVYNAKTGEQIYRRRIGDKGGAFTASPVAAGGKIYFPSEDGEIFVVMAGPKYELLAENKMGEVLMATPAITDGMLIVRGLKHVYGIGEAGARARR